CKRVEGPNYLHYPVTVIQAEKKEGFARMCTAAQAKEVVSDRRRHQNVPGYIPFTGVLSRPCQQSCRDGLRMSALLSVDRL
ncbi:MAG: hypothetical protein ACLTLE_09240, partial [Lachnospiraceae bacterium]